MRRNDPIPALKLQVGAELAALLVGWNADDAAAKIGTDRPRISEIRRGKLSRFSLETLIRYVCCFRRTVEIRVVAIPPHRPVVSRLAKPRPAESEYDFDDEEMEEEE
jgi:predicted XRE-type DNA-binding protein